MRQSNLGRLSKMLLDEKKYSFFKDRRKKLIKNLKQQLGVNQGVMILNSGFEDSRYRFRPDSSFYYLTGIAEPAAVLLMSFDGKDVLYVPDFGDEREKWLNVWISPAHEAAQFGFDSIKYLSEPVKGYSYSPYFDAQHYKLFLRDFSQLFDDQAIVFSLFQENSPVGHTRFFEFLEQQVPAIKTKKQDISAVLFDLRRNKDSSEIDAIGKAIKITQQAHHVVAQAIMPGQKEYEIQAKLEYVFTKNNTQPAFASIVATGKNTTVLHYVDRDQEIQEGDLVVVDIGAQYAHYAADLTRTYPANRTFSKRQREVYEIVLEAQNYIEQVAKPGMFLKNEEEQARSLHHIAVGFFKQKGYDRYFLHGIGHFLGLDVHDVGDNKKPLSPGDIFTIEPGLYISEEKLGIRIEDNYLMTEQGVECLSNQLPKGITEIEALMNDD